MGRKEKNPLSDFFDLKTKEIFPNFEEPRKEGSLITQKQIAYVYVLAKQFEIEKEDLEDTEFRHFTAEEAREFIDLIKEGRFYEKYKRRGIEKFIEEIEEDDDDDFLF